MQTITITNGSRQVIASRNSQSSRWSARLYVNNGETACLQTWKGKTEKGLRDWAAKVMG